MIKRRNGDEIVEVKNERQNGYVSWVAFVWAIGIILIVFGLVFNQIAALSAKSTEDRDNYTCIKEDIRELKTNVNWIVSTMGKPTHNK